MENNAGAIRIRVVSAMSAIAKPIAITFHLPRWTWPRGLFTASRRRRATLDLIHSSPHLLRDIGVAEGKVVLRDR